MAFSIEILILALFTIAMAVAAIESEKISRAIVFLALASIGVGSIFLIVGALYAAMLEYFMYGGALIILFMVAASFTKDKKEDETDE